MKKDIFLALIIVFGIYKCACAAWSGNASLSGGHFLIAPDKPNLPNNHERNSKDCPKLVAEFGGPSTGYESMEISGDYVFLGTHMGELKIFDISDPHNAFEVSTYEFGAQYVNSLTKDGSYIYATYWYFPMLRAYWETCFAILDVSDVNNVRKLGQYCHSSVEGEFTYGSTAIIGNYALVTGPGIQVFDISDKQHPSPLKNYPDYGFANMELIGHYGYTNEVAIYDVSDPLDIARIGYLDVVSSSVMALSVDHNYVYVPAWPTGFKIIDVSDVADPKLVSSQDEDKRIFGISLFENVLCISGYNENLSEDIIEIFDVSNNKYPKKMGSYTLRGKGWLYGVILKDQYAFIRTGGQIIVFDLSACKASGHRRPVTRP
jgi:hypothetical protein